MTNMAVQQQACCARTPLPPATRAAAAPPPPPSLRYPLPLHRPTWTGPTSTTASSLNHTLTLTNTPPPPPTRMDWTDVHYRQLARLISRHTWLWTEMVVDRTILHAAPLDKWLWFPPEQHPIVLQVGGVWGAGRGMCVCLGGWWVGGGLQLQRRAAAPHRAARVSGVWGLCYIQTG